MTRYSIIATNTDQKLIRIVLLFLTSLTTASVKIALGLWSKVLENYAQTRQFSVSVIQENSKVHVR